MRKKVIQFSVFALLLLFACKKEDSVDPDSLAAPEFNPGITYGSMTDREGNSYKTVTIGTQTWMTENLRTTVYNDGAPIPNITDNDEWGSLSTGAYCNYKDTLNTVVIDIYGRLYNWNAVNSGKLAPEGWHIPSDEEWTTLINYLGGENVACAKLKEAGINHWGNLNTTATNESGFTALPGGIRGYDNKFFSMGFYGFWWTSTAQSEHSGLCYDLHYNDDVVGNEDMNKQYGLSIRCIKD